MAIAEEEIVAARTRGNAKVVDACFGACFPTPELRDLSDAVYRAHVRELLARATGGEDLRPGTNAEVAAAFQLSSLRAPLTASATLAYEKAFESVFRGDAKSLAVLEPRMGREAYPGELAELLAEARRKTAKPWRAVGCRPGGG